MLARLRELNWQTSAKKKRTYLRGRFCVHILKNFAKNNESDYKLEKQILGVKSMEQNFSASHYTFHSVSFGRALDGRNETVCLRLTISRGLRPTSETFSGRSKKHNINATPLTLHMEGFWITARW